MKKRAFPTDIQILWKENFLYSFKNRKISFIFEVNSQKIELASPNWGLRILLIKEKLEMPRKS